MDDFLALETDTPVLPTPPPPGKSVSFYIQRITGAILLVALAGVFFYSAWSKIYSDNAFDNFQWTFIDLGISSAIAASFIAHFMIGFEILLGLFLLCHIYLKSFTYKAVIVILSVFIVYLLIVILKQGNTGNCGCFGDKLAMTPLNAIWKNLGMIAATLVLWKIYPIKPYKYSEIAFIVVAGIALTIPFLMRLVYVGTEPEKVGKAIDLNPLYQYAPAPTVDLKTGKHIVAFMSLTCPHCKKAAYLLQIIHREHPDYSIYLVLAGPEPYFKKFFDETHASGVPYMYYKDHEQDFEKMAGTSVPSILWVNNSTVEYKSTYAYYQLDPQFMATWFKK